MHDTFSGIGRLLCAARHRLTGAPWPVAAARARRGGGAEPRQALLIAVRNADAAAAADWLRLGADPAAEGSDGVSALQAAVLREHAPVLAVVLRAARRLGRNDAIASARALATDTGRCGLGACPAPWPDAPWSAGHTPPAHPLVAASAAGDLRAADRELRAGRDPRRLGEALAAAAGRGDAALARRLLDAGAEACAGRHARISPALLRAAAAGDAACLRLILAAGGLRPDPALARDVALAAARSAAASAVLLGAGAHPWPDDGAALRPLREAALDGDGDRVAVLLAAGAGRDPTDPEGRNARLHAAVAGAPAVLALLADAGATREPLPAAELVRLALDRGRIDRLPVLLRLPDALAPVPGREPATVAAVRREPPDALGLLLAAGADPDAAGADGRTALHVAAGCPGKAAHAFALLRAGAAPDCACRRGRTALIAAAGAPRPEVIRLLLAAGADPDLADAAGRAALDHAADGLLPGPGAAITAPAVREAVLLLAAASRRHPARTALAAAAGWSMHEMMRASARCDRERAAGLAAARPAEAPAAPIR